MSQEFSSPTGDVVFYRTYSRRKPDGKRESFIEAVERSVKGIGNVGKLKSEEIELLSKQFKEKRALPSGRWLWVGGTDWVEKPENHIGAYNCFYFIPRTSEDLAMSMRCLMSGGGVGLNIEKTTLEQLPDIHSRLTVEFEGEYGTIPKGQRLENTHILLRGNKIELTIGDSAEGWVQAYQRLVDFAFGDSEKYGIPLQTEYEILINLSHIRASGEKINGFGGVANPSGLKLMLKRISEILSQAYGRKLTALELCLLADEPAKCIVAGNVRRSANIRLFSDDEPLLKMGLWQEDENGNWRIDPERDALRMGNHTRCFHHYPSLEEITESIRCQWESGEGAIQYAPNAIIRGNADVFNEMDGVAFRAMYSHDREGAANLIRICFEEKYGKEISERELDYRMNCYGQNPCGESILGGFSETEPKGGGNSCNLSEVYLGEIDPLDKVTQSLALTAAAVSSASLLNHTFTDVLLQETREIDPRATVSISGIFDFFVQLLGVEYLQWWDEGRPDNEQGKGFKKIEKEYLIFWKDQVFNAMADYCNHNGLKVPNRCTTLQPGGTKSLLTNSSPGWHLPFSERYIRRITMRRNDPVALASIDYGYNVVPSQSDKDENGMLLNDPFDPRCTEWLIEIPVEVKWAGLADDYGISVRNFSALAKFDFYMQVQKYYTTDNTSGTITLIESEIEPMAQLVHKALPQGYVSVCFLAKNETGNHTYPRMPYEEIDKFTYEKLILEQEQRRKSNDFLALLNQYDTAETLTDMPSGCDGDKCSITPTKP